MSENDPGYIPGNPQNLHDLTRQYLDGVLPWATYRAYEIAFERQNAGPRLSDYPQKQKTTATESGLPRRKTLFRRSR